MVAVAARQFGAFAFFVGFLCGLAYGLGGAVVDLMTTGWNRGTWLALNAIWAMPFLATPFGVVGGLLWVPIANRLPPAWGGFANAQNGP